MSWEFDFGHFNEVFSLENNSVAIKYSKEEVEREKHKPIRICQAMLESRLGKTITIGIANHLCLGGNYWCGLSEEITERQISHLVDTEHIFASRPAALRAFLLGFPPPRKLGKSIMFSPLLQSEFKPDLVILFVRPRNASELLTLTVYHHGIPLKDIMVNGATCRLAIANPLVSGQVGISFADMACRTRYPWGYKDDELLISYPVNIFEALVKNYEGKRLLPKYIPVP